MEAIHIIEPDTALVISGPQGCGKTVMARRIATSIGPFQEISFQALMNDEALKDHLSKDTAALIVDEIDWDAVALKAKTMGRLKDLITSATVRFRPPYGKESISMPMPKLIFTTNDTEPARLMCEGNRRLVLLELSASGHPVAC